MLGIHADLDTHDTSDGNFKGIVHFSSSGGGGHGEYPIHHHERHAPLISEHQHHTPPKSEHGVEILEKGQELLNGALESFPGAAQVGANLASGALKAVDKVVPGMSKVVEQGGELLKNVKPGEIVSTVTNAGKQLVSGISGSGQY